MNRDLNNSSSAAEEKDLSDFPGQNSSNTLKDLLGENSFEDHPNNVTPEYYEVDCHPFDSLMELSHSYYLPCMIFIGLVGNALSCIVFLTTHLKMRSSSYYLAALACADLGFLVALLVVWLSSTLDVPLFHTDGVCQCIVYLSSVCGFLSVWLIVAFTVERFIAVQYPLHRPHMCTVARAKAIVLYLVGFALVAHIYVFWTSGIITMEEGMQLCEMLEKYRDTMRIINIVDSLLTLIIPLILIVAMNVMIAVNLFQFSQKFKKDDDESLQREGTGTEIELHSLPKASKSSSNNNNSKHNPSQQSFHSTRSNNSSHIPQSFKLRSCDVPISRTTYTGPGRGLISAKTQYSITKMLLLVSTVFILLNFPSYVIRLYVFVFNFIWSESPSEGLWCAQQLFMTLYYTNFSVNFLLYSVYGITFRKCLSQLIRSKIKWISVYSCRRSA